MRPVNQAHVLATWCTWSIALFWSWPVSSRICYCWQIWRTGALPLQYQCKWIFI